MSAPDYLGEILERKRREVARRLRRIARTASSVTAPTPVARAQIIGALRRAPGQLPRVIAEIKRRSPSAGAIRPYQRGDVGQLARAYVAGGAAAVSVLCDGPGFGGSPLDVRRAAHAVDVPVLFKEFVLDEIQLDLARAVGASLVLLLVRALTKEQLHALVAATLARGLVPVVEAANAGEVSTALETRASIVGVNARDLATFQVDKSAAQRALASIPPDRIAVHMSGIKSPADLAEVARGRADAALVGESLMRAADPTAQLRALLGS